MTLPSHAWPGAIVGVVLTAMVARPAGVLSPFLGSATLPSVAITSLKPGLLGTRAARYQTLSRATQSPSTTLLVAAPKSSILFTNPWDDHTISVGCWPWNFSGASCHA